MRNGRYFGGAPAGGVVGAGAGVVASAGGGVADAGLPQALQASSRLARRAAAAVPLTTDPGPRCPMIASASAPSMNSTAKRW